MRSEKLNFKAFKKEALSNPEVKKEYERLKPYYELKKGLKELRNYYYNTDIGDLILNGEELKEEFSEEEIKKWEDKRK